MEEKKNSFSLKKWLVEGVEIRDQAQHADPLTFSPSFMYSLTKLKKLLAGPDAPGRSSHVFAYLRRAASAPCIFSLLTYYVRH